jgi:hypothetical protein
MHISSGKVGQSDFLHLKSVGIKFWRSKDLINVKDTIMFVSRDHKYESHTSRIASWMTMIHRQGGIVVSSIFLTVKQYLYNVSGANVILTRIER